MSIMYSCCLRIFFVVSCKERERERENNNNNAAARTRPRNQALKTICSKKKTHTTIRVDDDNKHKYIRFVETNNVIKKS